MFILAFLKEVKNLVLQDAMANLICIIQVLLTSSRDWNLTLKDTANNPSCQATVQDIHAVDKSPKSMCKKNKKSPFNLNTVYRNM